MGDNKFIFSVLHTCPSLVNWGSKHIEKKNFCFPGNSLNKIESLYITPIDLVPHYWKESPVNHQSIFTKQLQTSRHHYKGDEDRTWWSLVILLLFYMVTQCHWAVPWAVCMPVPPKISVLNVNSKVMLFESGNSVLIHGGNEIRACTLPQNPAGGSVLWVKSSMTVIPDSLSSRTIKKNHFF